MVRGGKLTKVIIQCCAVIVTFWFSSHLFYVVDHGYRTELQRRFFDNFGGGR